MNLKQWKKALIKNNVCDAGEEFPFLVLAGAVEVGANKKKVKSWLGKLTKKQELLLEEYWLNGVKNKIFKNGFVHMEIDEKDDGVSGISFVLTGLCLSGLVKRSEK